jgi:UDP-glucuronate 4-epimerase
MKKVLVTGGAGFIGSHLVDHLLSHSDFRVTVLDNFNQFYDPAIKRKNISSHLGRSNFELIEADIVDSKTVNDLFRRSRV